MALNGSWEARVVAQLLELRTAGVVDFEEAWALARARVPDTGARRSPERLKLGEWCVETFPGWFKRMCHREWCGQVRVDYAGLEEFAAGLDEGGVTALPAGWRRRG